MKLRHIFLAVSLSVFTFSPIFAQFVEFQLAKIDEFKIEGDSNVRKWDATIQEAEGRLILSELENMDIEFLKPEHFSSLSLSIPVDQITTDNSLLTRNIHNNLKAEEHASITFTLGEVISITNDENTYTISAYGTIEAAGNTHQANLLVKAESVDNRKIRFSGSHDMLMTDFDITPPTAMMGTFRSHDEITVRFNVTFTSNN